MKFRERCLCPLIALANLGVAIELYTTKVLNDAKIKLDSSGIRTHASEETDA